MKPIRSLLQQTYSAAVSAVDPRSLIERRLTLTDGCLSFAGRGCALPTEHNGRVIVLGAGKGAVRMASGLLELLGDRPLTGCVITKTHHAAPVGPLQVLEAEHPAPGSGSASAGAALLEAARAAEPNDVILFCLTGGASSLAVCPAGITLAEKAHVNRLLVAAGAAIREINMVRKHLSEIKGGQLLRAAQPAMLTTLALSDVLDNDPSTIGSGPTVPDPSTYADSLEVLNRYDLSQRVGKAIIERLTAGARGTLPETPKPAELPDALEQFWLLGSLDDAIRAAAAYARSVGQSVATLSEPLSGHTHREAERFVRRALELQQAGFTGMLIGGGETTLKVTGPGKGGRSQELALAAGKCLANVQGITILAAGTDGTDGPTDAAGAFADAGTVGRLQACGRPIDVVLAENDAYPALQQIKDLFVTGPTGTNVTDLALAAIERAG